MKRTCTPTRRQRGFTLVELLVAMVIGLVVILAVTSVVSVGQAHKRTTTSNNDMSQAGSYAAYVLDRALRSAGSGFTQSWDLGAFGCRLSAAAILPRIDTAFPAPFAGLLGGAGAGNAGNLRLAPLLIGKGQSVGGSDILVVMGGDATAGGIARPILSAGASANILRLRNTIGLAQGDVGLVSQAGVQDCLMEQINASPAFADSAGNETIPLGSTYYTASGADTSLATFASGGSAYFTSLGNANAGNVQFQLFGVGDNRTLFSYDLLQGSGTDESQAIADGVVELHAIYGVDTDDDGIRDAWMDPGATGYDIATLMTTPATLRRIVAVRMALVLRSANFEKELVSPPELTLFNELPAAGAGTPPVCAGAPNACRHTVVLDANDQHYRYRVIESTIPLRNMLLLPTS